MESLVCNGRYVRKTFENVKISTEGLLYGSALFDHCRFKDCIFQNMEGAVLNRCQIRGCSFEDSMEGAVLNECLTVDVLFNASNMRAYGTKFASTKDDRCALETGDFARIDISGDDSELNLLNMHTAASCLEVSGRTNVDVDYSNMYFFPEKGSFDEMRQWWTAHDSVYRDREYDEVLLRNFAGRTADMLQRVSGMNDRDACLFRTGLLTEHVDAAFDFVDGGDKYYLKSVLCNDVEEHVPGDVRQKFVSACIMRDGSPGPEALREDIMKFAAEKEPEGEYSRIAEAYMDESITFSAMDVSKELGVPYYDVSRAIYGSFYRNMPVFSSEELQKDVLEPLQAKCDKASFKKAVSGGRGMRPSERLMMELDGMDDGTSLEDQRNLE